MRTWTNPRTAPKTADAAQGIMVMMHLDDGVGLRIGYASSAAPDPGTWALHGQETGEPETPYPWRTFKKAHRVVKWAYVARFFEKDLARQRELDAAKAAKEPAP